jgi:hypothetical protein
MVSRSSFGGVLMRSCSSAIAALYLSVLVLAGCEPQHSLYPLYKDDDTAADDRLIGIWQPVGADGLDKEQRWTFVHSKQNKSYDVTLGAVGQKGGFVAKVRLVGLGNYTFVDCSGDFERINPGGDLIELMPYPALPTHMIGRVWLDKDSLRLHFLKDEWVKNQAQAGTLTLAHLDMDGDPLLSATTDELRKFMLGHADDADALSENYELQRVN